MLRGVWSQRPERTVPATGNRQEAALGGPAGAASTSKCTRVQALGCSKLNMFCRLDVLCSILPCSIQRWRVLFNPVMFYPVLPCSVQLLTCSTQSKPAMFCLDSAMFFSLLTCFVQSCHILFDVDAFCSISPCSVQPWSVLFSPAMISSISVCCVKSWQFLMNLVMFCPILPYHAWISNVVVLDCCPLRIRMMQPFQLKYRNRWIADSVVLI